MGVPKGSYSPKSSQNRNISSPIEHSSGEVKNHDLADDEIQFRQVDIDDLYLPKHDIMTTWHNDFDDGIWFSIFAANDEDVTIEKVVILDMTDGRESNRINNLLNKFSLEE